MNQTLFQVNNQHQTVCAVRSVLDPHCLQSLLADDMSPAGKELIPLAVYEYFKDPEHLLYLPENVKHFYS